MQIQKLLQKGARLIHIGLSTTHNRFILAGLFVGLCYFPFWMAGLVNKSLSGSSALVLGLAACGLGFENLWRKRKELAKIVPSEEDRLLGHVIIGAGIVLFPFCLFAVWSKALIWIAIMIGIAISCWGVSFFWQYPIPTLMFSLSAYPKPGEVARSLWEVATPPAALEKFMAWMGATGLNAVGFNAQAQHTLVVLPQGAVEVNWACNGFSMALSVAATGLIMGLFLKLHPRKIAFAIFFGVILALLFNVPRIMILALASVYWGEETFNFWHGSWGSQVFTGVLLTIYYYAVMALAKDKPTKAKA